MIGLVMAGGKGTRMHLPCEKLLLRYKKPVILHVVDSLHDSDCFSNILAVTSHNSPQTKKLLEENDIETLNTLGTSYTLDLNFVLRNLSDSIFVVSGDLPLLDGEIIQTIVKQYNPQKIWTSVLVTSKFLASLGLQSDCSVDFTQHRCHYTGISLINSRKITDLQDVHEDYVIIDDKRVAFNLNSKQDYDNLLNCT